ncbi:hypothetical protein L596_021401 [Steinernema carpocapsae]|uniref:Aminotransferase class I/classII large domain-containing protein n=1 Tax=Steinernema carpocapsae TaxID=34508 RepID=A0A4U5MIM4_STECR|nr:hypothetical protein L596_021401 [Steinernema carpocapsae]
MASSDRRQESDDDLHFDSPYLRRNRNVLDDSMNLLCSKDTNLEFLLQEFFSYCCVPCKHTHNECGRIAVEAVAGSHYDDPRFQLFILSPLLSTPLRCFNAILIDALAEFKGFHRQKRLSRDDPPQCRVFLSNRRWFLKMVDFEQEIIREDLRNTGGASNLEFNNRLKRMIAEGKTVHHFGFGQSPFPIPEPIVQGLRDHADKCQYLSVAGIPELRQEIINFHNHYDDFHHFTPDNVVLVPGCKQIIYQIMNCFSGEVLLVAPSWVSYKPQAELCKRKAKVLITRRENNFVPTPEEVEEALKDLDPSNRKLLIINTPNNPTGHVFTEEELKAITEVCRKHKIICISDEIYARLTPKKHLSLSRYYPEGTIVTTGYSKWASAGGWRIGYGLFPKELNKFQKVVAGACSQTITCAPSPMQFGICQGLKQIEELDKYCRRCTRILELCGRFTHRHLESVGVTGNAPEGAYYYMPDFHVVKSEKLKTCNEMCERLLNEAGVGLMACDPHYLRPEGEFTVRFCFINFDGRKAYAAIDDFDGKDEEAFVRHYCAPLADGVDAIKKWVLANTPKKE